MKKSFFKKNIFVIILVIVFALVAGFYFIREYFASKSIYIDSTLTDKKYEMIPKTYDVNEYTNILISDEDMVRIYLMDYINTINRDIEKSYYLLDEEYRDKRFGTLDNYILYISSIDYSSFEMSKYYKKSIDKYTIFGVYNEYDSFIGFKTNGVMQYSVYLDEDTVEIW